MDMWSSSLILEDGSQVRDDTHYCHNQHAIHDCSNQIEVEAFYAVTLL